MTKVINEKANIQSELDLKSRRYIGNKFKLNDWIFNSIEQEGIKFNSFFDVFTGTGVVSEHANRYCDKLILNDILYSNNVIYNAFFLNQNYDKAKLVEYVSYLNSIDSEKLRPNYFSKNYGGKFYEELNSRKVGYIRETLIKDKKNFNQKEYSILLASLIYSIDRIANTVGHFDAYIKKEIKKRDLYLKLIKPITTKQVEIHREDANILANKIEADIAYIDPPYNSRQYSRFYHLYENLIKWDKPELFGVAMKPKPSELSKYCTVSAKSTFEDLINKLKVKHIVVSYNNTYKSKSNSSANKIKLEEISSILHKAGPTKVYEKSHQFFNTGKTDFNDHKEFLFITQNKIKHG